MPEALERIARCARCCRRTIPIQVDGGIGDDNVARGRTTPARRCSSPAARSSTARTCRARTARLVQALRVTTSSARSSSRSAGAARSRDHPLVGAVLVARRRGRRRGLVRVRRRSTTPRCVALAQAGERARGATLYVTLEPCAHHGRTPPCTDAVIDAGVARVVVGARDPNPVAAGGHRAAARARAIEVELARRVRGTPPERGVAHVEGARPAVRHLQGRGHARRPRHGARARAGSRARSRGGSCTSCAPRRTRSPSGWAPCAPTHPRLDARDVDAPRAAAPARVRPRARCPTAPSSSCAAGRSRTSCARSPPRASSRSCSKAARRSRPRSSRPISSTSCSLFVAPIARGRRPALRRRLAAPLDSAAYAPHGRRRRAPEAYVHEL